MELEVVIGGINQLLTPVKGGANIFQTLDETLKGFHTFLDSSNQSRLRAAHYDTITDLTIPKYDSERQAMSCKEDVNRYCQFTLQALALLCLLDDSLKKAHADDLNSAMERSRTHHEKEKQHFTPKALLSPAEEKKIHTLLQFVVALGVFPFLIPGADNLLRLQLGETAALIKKCNGDDNMRAFFLYHHCRLVSRLFTTPVIGPSIVTRHLSAVLVAVMQICYAPREQQKHGTEDASHISSPSVSQRPDEAVSTTSLSVQQKSNEELNHLLDRLHQPLVVRELLSLQKFIFKGQKRDGGKGTIGLVTPKWLQRACGRLLSGLLLKEKGVHKVLLGIFESIPGGEGIGSGCQGDWMRVQAVAKIISQCPSQVSSQSQYYSIIAPQLLELLGSPMAASVQVVAHTISIMIRQQPALARKHLMQPLTQAIMQLFLKDCHTDGLGGNIEVAIKRIARLCNFTEPSSPLLKEILPLLPIFFELWRASKTAKNEIRSELASVITALLNSVESSTIIHLLRHLCGMPFSAQSTVEWVKFSSDITIEVSSEEYAIVNLSRENWGVERMESTGEAILEFLGTLLKSKKLIGKFFVECFRFVIAVLCNDVGYQTQVSSVQTEIRMQRPGKTTSTSSSSTSSALLDLENKQCNPSQAEAFHRSMALYLTASLSENNTSEVLEQADTAELLDILFVAIDCHAHHVKRKKCDTSSSSLNSLLLVRPDLDQMLGGPITLSISLGYLSALLGGAMQVEQEHRPVLSGMMESLEIISTGYPEQELSTLAGDVRVCIATLGAVWSAEMKEWAHGKKMVPEAKRLPIHTSLRQPPTPKEAGIETERTPYQQALIEACDAEIPVKGHGLASLARLVENGDKETLTDLVTLLEMFRDSLQHPDSYVYLPAITGLVALASKQPIKVLTVLCEGYAMFSKSGMAKNEKKFDSETGTLKVQSEKQQLIEKNKQNEGGKVLEASLDFRLKLGEALVRVCRECGEMLPHYSDILLAAVLCNVRDPHPLIRASALSNLAEVSKLLSHSFGNIQHEVLSCVTQLILTDPTPQVQQAALLVLSLLLKGLSNQTIGILGDSLRDVYHLLKRVEGESLRDELTRTHARAALGQLDHIMREWIFPQQTFSKKITIL